MRRGVRRRASLTWAILFGVLGGMTVVSAWKFGWVSIDIAQFKAGLPLEANPEDGSQLAAGPAAAQLTQGESADGDAEPAGLIAETRRQAFDVRHQVSSVPMLIAEQPGGALSPARWPNQAGNSQNRVPLQIDDPSSIDLPQTRTGVVQVSNEVRQESQRFDPRLQAIDRLIQSADVLAAHRELSQLYWDRPELKAAIQSRIEETARIIFFSPQPHFLEPHVVQPGDQLQRIATAYHVPWNYLAKLNQIDARKIRPGQKLKVIRGPFAAVVDLSDHEITVHLQGHFVCRFDVGIGKDNSTPLGKFPVRDKLVNPQYTDPQGRVVDADDPANPLGERWIDLGDSYGIHGTIDETSIGRAESRGCVRLRNADVAVLFDLLVIGSEVVIRR